MYDSYTRITSKIFKVNNMDFSKVKCVIFDMDGVIINSEEIHKKAYYETFKSIGVDVSEELYKSFTGSSTLNAFQKLLRFTNNSFLERCLWSRATFD